MDHTLEIHGQIRASRSSRPSRFPMERNTSVRAVNRQCHRKSLPVAAFPARQQNLLTKQGALIAAIVASVFSWPTIISSPWTAKACFYTTLYLSLFAVTCGFQQNITLVRYGKDAEGVAMLQKLLRSTNGKSAGRLHLFVWQIPIMLVNFSIMSFLMGLSILIWDQTTTSVKTDLAVSGS